MADFKIGDRVEGIDDTVKGKVVAIRPHEIVVESEEGFLLPFTPEALIKVPKKGSLSVSNYEINQIKADKETPRKPQRPVPKTKERNAPKMEVDLHINQLVKTVKGLGNHEMLNLQLETAKRQLEFAIRKRIQKIVFIHGVGEGVLKEELYYLFRQYDNVTYYDADYQNYGAGATEVYIYQNG